MAGKRLADFGPNADGSDVKLPFGKAEEYRSPTDWLSHFFAVEAEEVKLRKSGHRPRRSKEDGEARQAAIFGYAYGRANRIDSLALRPGEGPSRDYDVMFRWIADKGPSYVPVQLKRLPPERTNKNVTLRSLIDASANRCTGDDLIFAIHLDRRMALKNLTIPAMRIREFCAWGWADSNYSEIYLFSLSKEQSKWSNAESRFRPLVSGGLAGLVDCGATSM